MIGMMRCLCVVLDMMCFNDSVCEKTHKSFENETNHENIENYVFATSLIDELREKESLPCTFLQNMWMAFQI